MKILYITRNNTSQDTGDIRHIFEVVENLCNLGNRVFVLVPKIGKYNYGTKAHIVYIPVIKNRLLLPLFYPILLLLIYPWFHLILKPNVVYERQMSISFMGFVTKVLRCAYILEVNGIISIQSRINREPNWKINIIIFFEKLSFRLTDKIIAVTKGLRELIAGNYHVRKSKIGVIGNGCNPDISRPLDMAFCKKELKLDQDIHYICFVGTLNIWQGVEVLIRCCPFVIREFPNIKFLIVGQGKMMGSYKNLSRNLGVEKYFIFTGQIPYRKVPLYINAAALCVAPFIYERNSEIGLSPIKIFEYTSCGKAIVTTRIKDLYEEIEKHRVGIVVAPENPDEFAGAILKLLKNKSLREEMGLNGRLWVEREKSWKEITRNIHSFLEKTVRGSI